MISQSEMPKILHGPISYMRRKIKRDIQILKKRFEFDKSEN